MFNEIIVAASNLLYLEPIRNILCNTANHTEIM